MKPCFGSLRLSTRSEAVHPSRRRETREGSEPVLDGVLPKLNRRSGNASYTVQNPCFPVILLREAFPVRRRDDSLSSGHIVQHNRQAGLDA
jgi:hypothetical protein